MGDEASQVVSLTPCASIISSTAVSRVRSSGVHTAAAGPSGTASICRCSRPASAPMRLCWAHSYPERVRHETRRIEQLAVFGTELGVGAGEHLGEGEPRCAQGKVMREHLEHDRHRWRIGIARQVDLGSTQELQERRAGGLVPFGEGQRCESGFRHARVF